jgi:YVTN family beta-propeller protein
MAQTRAVRWACTVVGPRIARLAIAVALSACSGPRVRAPLPPPGPPPTAPALLASIPVGEGLARLALAPDGRHLYAANDSLMVIDTAAEAIVQTHALKGVATRIAIAPDGSRVYLTRMLSDRLFVYDVARNQVTTPIRLYKPYFHGHIAAAPDNQTLYIADSQNGALGVVDLRAGRSRLLKPSVRPYDVSVSGDGRGVYTVGCTDHGCRPGYLQRLDVATRTFAEPLAITPHPRRVVLSPDGQRAYVVHFGPPSVSIIDLAGSRVTGTVLLPRTSKEAGTPEEAAISPDGATLYVTSQEAGKVTAIDTRTAAVRSQTSIVLAHGIAMAPDGSRLYVSTAGEVAQERVLEPPRKGSDRAREFGDASLEIKGTSSVMVIAPPAAR